MADIVIPSEQQLTKILKVLDRVEEKQEKELNDLKQRISTWDDVWTDGRSRLEELERRASQGLRSGNLDVPENRAELLRNWIADKMCFAFIKGYQGRGAGESTIADDGSLNAGGYLVPKPLQPEVIRIVEQYGLVRRLFTQVPMSVDTLDLNSLLGATGSDAGITVGFKAELAGQTSSRPTYIRKTLNASKLIAINEMSLELEADSAIALASFLLELFGEAIAKKEDVEGLTGDTNASPANEFDGVTVEASGSHNLSSGESDIADITYEDVVDLMGTVNDFVQETGVFVFNSKVLRHFRKLREGSGTGALLWSPMAGDQPATILGRPYYVSPVMPGDGANKKPVIYGDFSKAYMGIRSGFEVAFSDDVGFTKASRVMRVMERIAFKVVVPQAFGVIKLGAV